MENDMNMRVSGGVDSVGVDIRAFGKHPIGRVELVMIGDSYQLTFARNVDDEPVILMEGHRYEGEIQTIYDTMRKLTR